MARRRWVSAATSLLTIAALQAPAALASTRGGTSRTLLVLGDSLSAEYGLERGTGWVALLEARLQARADGWRVVNASISGETTAGGASRISGLLERHAPALVIVELGGNDALRGLDLNGTRSNLERIVRASREAGAKVLLLGMQVPPNYGKAYTEAFARLFAEVSGKHEAALVPFFLEPIAEDLAYFQADRIHPNSIAQPLMLDAVWPTLEPMLG